MRKKGSKYISAHKEMSDALSSQQTISITKLKRLLNNMNISIHPDNTSQNVEVAYLKAEIRKRDKKLSIMGKRIKELSKQGK